MILVMRTTSSEIRPAFFVTSAASPAFLLSDRARPPMTFSGVPTSCAISAAIWPMVASFSAWRRRSSRSSRALAARSPSSRASRSEPVMALNRAAMVPISSSRSARMTRDRSPLPTASMPSTRRRSGWTTVWRSANRTPSATPMTTMTNSGTIRRAVAATSASMYPVSRRMPMLAIGLRAGWRRGSSRAAAS